MDYQQYQQDYSFLPAISPPSMPPWQQQPQLQQPSSPFRNIPQQNNPNQYANRVNQSIRFDSFPQNSWGFSQPNRMSNQFPMQLPQQPQQNTPIKTKISMSPQSQQQYNLTNEQSLRSPMMNRFPYENTINSPIKYYKRQDIQQYPSIGSSPSQQYQQQPLVQSPFKRPSNLGYINNVSQVLNSNDWLSPQNRWRNENKHHPFIQSVQYAEGLENQIISNQHSPIATEQVSNRRSYQRSSTQNKNHRSIDEGYLKQNNGGLNRNQRDSSKDGSMINQSAYQNENNRNSYKHHQGYLESYNDDGNDGNNSEEEMNNGRKQSGYRQQFYENKPTRFRQYKPLKQLNNEVDYQNMRDYIDNNAELYSNYSSSNRNKNQRSFSTNNKFVEPNGRDNSTQKKRYEKQHSMVNQEYFDEKLARKTSICLKELEQIERENKAKAMQEYSKQLEEQIEQDKQKRRQEKLKRDMEELMYEQEFQRIYQHEQIHSNAPRQTKRHTSLSDDRVIKGMNEGERNQQIEEDLLVSGDNQGSQKKVNDSSQVEKKEEKKIGRSRRSINDKNNRGKSRNIKGNKSDDMEKKDEKGKGQDEKNDKDKGIKEIAVDNGGNIKEQQDVKDKRVEEDQNGKEKKQENNDKDIGNSVIDSKQDQNKKNLVSEQLVNHKEEGGIKEDIEKGQEQHEGTLLTLQVEDQGNDNHQIGNELKDKEGQVQMKQEHQNKVQEKKEEEKKEEEKKEEEEEEKENNDNNCEEDNNKEKKQVAKNEEIGRKKSNDLNVDESKDNSEKEVSQKRDVSEIPKQSHIVNSQKPIKESDQSGNLSLIQSSNPREQNESKIEHLQQNQLKKRIHRKNRSTDKRVIMTKLSQLGRNQQKLEQTVQDIQNLTQINNQNSRKQLFLLESAIARLTNNTNE